MGKRVTTNVKRLRAIRAIAPPICCLVPMTLTYLHMEPLTDEQKAALTEAQEADRLAGAVLPPVWSCETCEHEEDVEGIDWPDPEAKEAAAPGELSKPGGEFKYCQHCGKSLNVSCVNRNT